jgi:hypothetical protein
MLSRQILAAAILVSAPVTAFAQATPPLAERVAGLPEREFMRWFMTMLSGAYHRTPGWEQYFGDVGPTEGCEPLREIANMIARRDIGLYRAAYLDMISKGFAPNALSDVPDNALAMQLSARMTRFEAELSPIVQPRAAEMAERARDWVVTHGYSGRRLGYSSAGVSYWEGRRGIVRLICALPPDNIEGALRGWKARSPDE